MRDRNSRRCLLANPPRAGEEGLEKTQLLKDKNFLIVRPKFRGRKTRTHTPPFLSAKQVRFVKILKRQNMTGKHSQVFFSITRKHSQVFFMGLLTPKTPFHPTFIEASYELLPSQENTRLNLFFQKKKKEKVKPKGFL